MSTIRETITSSVSLPREANSYLPVVVDALTEREYTLSDQITQAVVQQFRVSEDDVRSRLESIGMAVRPAPEPEPVVAEAEAFLNTEELKAEGEGEGKGKNKERIDSLERTVAKLTEVVEGLANLAQRHLGARN